MAEEESSKLGILSPDSERISAEKETDVEEKKKYKFEECVDIGKSIIDNIKASLLASSASFNTSKYAGQFENPYNKAYRYLEEHQALFMLEDLITLTVFHQPEKPFPFMIEVVKNYYSDGEKSY